MSELAHNESLDVIQELILKGKRNGLLKISDIRQQLVEYSWDGQKAEQVYTILNEKLGIQIVDDDRIAI